MRVTPWLIQAAERFPELLALQSDGEEYSYSTLLLRSLAHYRQLNHLEAGSRVAVLASPSAFFVELFHACHFAKVIFVPMNLRLSARELCLQIKNLKPSLLLHDEHYSPQAKELARRFDTIELMQWAQPGNIDTSEDEIAAITLDPNDPCTIIYTSGSSGRPKGVVLSHRNLQASAEAVIDHYKCQPGERWLCAMPLYHVGGLSILVRAAIGGMAIDLKRSFDVSEIDRELRSGVPHYLPLVPTMLKRIVDKSSEEGYPDSIKAVILGGARCELELANQARTIGLPIATSYGMTETASQIFSQRPSRISVDEDDCGMALGGIEVKLEEIDDGLSQVLIRGPQVSGVYWDNGFSVNSLCEDDWLHTGDYGRLSADSRLSIFGRSDDVILTGGENVMPEEVEVILELHPNIQACGVFGLTDPSWGQRVAAAVILHGDGELTAEAILAWCNERLASYKVPRQLFFVSELPRTKSGKLKRASLRKKYTRS